MKYITRAAREMVVYLDSLQLDNGLFYHAPSAPYWLGKRPTAGWLVGMQNCYVSCRKRIRIMRK